MTYKCGLTKNQYDELLNSFVTQFVGRVIDEDELNYAARAELAHLLADAIDAEDYSAKVADYCSKYGINHDVVINVLETARGIWPHELLAETGQLP
jgi:hypothetical protein